MNKYDAIIIGAGLGGLTAGATFSRAGKKVLIVEKHDKVGGYATNFKRKGYTFDASLHNFGPFTDNALMNEIVKELEIDKRLTYTSFNEYQHILFPEHDIHLTKGVNNFRQYCIDKFPDEKKGVEELFEKMCELRKEFDEIEVLNISIDKLEDEFPLLPVKFPLLVTLVYTTFKEFLEAHITDETLKGILSAFWWFYALPPSQVASILYIVPSINYLEHSGGYIQGTSQELSDTLASIITENGGTVLCKKEVTRVLIEESKAIGIECGDEIFYGDKIVANCSPHHLFLELCKEEELPKRFPKKIKKIELSLSGLHLFLGLDCNPEEIGFNGHNLTVFKSYDPEQNYEWVVNGEYEKTFYSGTNYTLIDPESTPVGKGTISFMSLDTIKNWEDLSEDEYRQKKEKVIDIFISKIEKELPGLREHIVVSELGTPVTMKRYTGNPEGAIYGSSQTVDQSGVNRLPQETPIEGLYITGAYVYPGGGYPSVIGAGYRLAHILLKEEE